MNDVVLVALITATPVLVGVVAGVIGKTASYLIGLVQDQSKKTIEAIKEERNAWKDRATLLQEDNADLRRRIEELEGQNMHHRSPSSRRR